MPEETRTVARAIITIGQYMLMVGQGADDGFVHLPGGHVEAGEEAR